MKRLLALLLLLSSAALHAQQLDWTNAVNVPNTVTNSSFEACPNNTQLPNCGPWQEGPGFQPGTWSSNYGSREYVFSYVSGLLFQDIDLTQYDTNLFNFTFSFSLNNSCRNSIGGSCTNINGPIDEFSAKIYFYDANGLNNEFTFLSGTPSTANIVCDFEILGLCIGGYSAQDQWQQFGWYSHVQSNSLFTSARIEFTGRDVGFWGGLYGPRLDNVNLTINYMPPPLPTSGGLAGMNVSAPGSDYIFIYRGNDPILFSQLAIKGEDLVGWTAVSTGGEALRISSITQPDPDYLFLYTEGNPTSGTYYSFQEQPPTVDCVLSPFDPTCVIDTLGIDDGTVDYSDPQQVLASLEEDPAIETGADDGTDDGSDDGTEVVEDEEEILVADETPAEETNLEKMLQEEEADEEEEEKVVVADNVVTETVSPAEQVTAAYRELTDEEKAAILADAISKNTLEGALAIASEATSAASNAGGSTTVVTDSSSTKTTSTISSSESTVVAQDTSSGPLNAEESKQDSSSSSTDGTDILETGRQIGAAALATILADSASSASDSVAQAESIAAVSAETSFTSADVTEVRTDTVAAEISVEVEFSSATNDAGNVIEENNSMILMATNESSTTTEQADTFAEIMQLEIKPETGEIKDKDLEFVQQILATTEQKQSDDLSNSTFSEEEKVTIASDPALANAFNLAPNINNLEAAGVLNQKQEEKSDAEKRADEVVAANAKEQEDINKNYMDADQSGIVAAMGADTDVSAYRTAMLRDNNNWYKPEDIYKGIIIKDNVRGSYFLEKGNTDTYKKMVDEQYK
jgi:hypothetical protein